MSRRRARFSSRFALLASMLGIAVGTGNIWRFPRIAARSGGSTGAGAFLVAWVVALVTWSLPLIVAEYAVGRAGRRGIVGSFAALAGPRLAWMGAFVGLVATAIMFYYSVVTGWCLYYLARSVATPLPANPTEAKLVWDQLQAGPTPVLCHLLAIGACGLAVHRGVRSIQRANQVLVPTLLVVVVVSVLKALSLPGAAQGMSYLFTPDWGTLLAPRPWLEALTQNAWDTGAGWGLILTYAAYMRRRDYVVKNAVATGVGNNCVSLLAAVMVFATVFAVLGSELSRARVIEVMQDSGPASTGLTFIWMPQLYARMTGGRVFAVLFFLGLSFAALSSLISMVELATGTLVDAGLPRVRALLVVVGVGFVLGLPSALDVTLLSNQDFVWVLGLILSGALVAAAVTRHGPVRLRRQVLADIPGDWRLGRAWDLTITWAIPVQALLLLGWWMYLSASRYAPDSWYDPFDPFSVATCLLQWTVGLGLGVVASGWLVRRLRPDHERAQQQDAC